MVDRKSAQLAEILVQAKFVTPEQVEKALETQRKNGGSLSQALVKLGYVTEESLTAFLGAHFSLASINLTHFEIDSQVLKSIPAHIARKYLVIPLDKIGNTITLAMSDPTDYDAINDIKFITGSNIDVVICAESAIRAAIDRYYGSAETSASLEEVLKNVGGGVVEEELDVEVLEEEEDVDLRELRKEIEEAPVVKLVNSIIHDAISKRASDIHLEPYDKVFRVRFRIDGILYEVMTPPLRLKGAITSRVKIMAELDIAERRLPQDGRIKVKLKNKTVDLRVSSIPTPFGEKIVMRILDKSSLIMNLKSLGFEGRQYDDFIRAINTPNGIVFITGPTGSGKTTTLYTALQELNSPEVNIITVEDPIEYQIHGMNQVQVKPEINLTFANSLRSFLRQDPDIILVGETRDRETAEIAVQAALTGHLVFSTLHTNDAAGAITRLINMGVEPFLISSSIILITAQRLVRRVCSECKKPVKLDPAILEELGMIPKQVEESVFYKGEGCSFCNQTGYRGRMAVHEILVINDEVRDLILKRADSNQIKEKARQLGMLTLRESALLKLSAGLTTAEEVMGATARDESLEA